MKIQVLHIEDCPNWQEAGDRVRLVLDSIGRGDVPVEFVLIRTEAEAVSSGFAGSPTILLDGQDLFPSQGNTADLACRVYLTERGFAAPVSGRTDWTADLVHDELVAINAALDAAYAEHGYGA